MKSDFVKVSGSLLSVGLLSLLLPLQANAAKINVSLSQESGNYGSDYNYSGPRLDMTINPDGSNWYYSLGYRDRKHDSKQRYTQASMEMSYRFRFDGGWIQPSINLQKDSTIYDSGSRLIVNLYSSETAYIYSFNDQWGVWGEVQFGLNTQASHTADNVKPTMDSDYLSWEFESGPRYYFANGSRLTMTYYNSGLKSDKGDTWGLSDDKSGQQARIYYYWKAPFGITVSPYFRLPIGYSKAYAWYDSAYHDEDHTNSKTYRYALQLSYPITDSFKISAEYYIEDTKYQDGFNLGKADGQVKYLSFGVSTVF